jgi:ABC-type Zn uptake system ZnuABC Zn-binding protein ZnuA
MKRLITALVVAAALVAPGPAAPAGELKIVCTTTDLASIAKSVAGDQAAVESITTGKEDPHFLAAKPSYIIKARSADLWVRVGMDLEVGWEPVLLDSARNPRVREGAPGHLDASRRVPRLGVPAEKVTRGMGDVHPQGNPHYWLDPLNGRIVAGEIATRLAELDPAGAQAYRRNLEAFRHRLDDAMFGGALVHRVGGARLWAWQVKGEMDRRLAELGLEGQAGGWWAALRPFRGRRMVTFHRSWVYFCHRFGLEVAAELEPKPGVPPSGGHLRRVVELMRAHNVRLILQEPFYPTKAAELVAGQTGAELVVVANSVGGDPAADDYLSLIGLVVDRVREALR